MQRSTIRQLHRTLIRPLTLFVLLALIPIAVFGQAGSPENPAELMAAQRKAMTPLAFMNGVWRGPAWIVVPSGHKVTFTQTERIGPMLADSIKVIEGRGYAPNGTVTFNAFAVVSFDPGQNKYTIHSYAEGRSGDFAFTPSADGYVWEIPAGPMTIRYTAHIKDGSWREVGDRILPGKTPIRFFEMDLKRVGNTNWPAAGAISPK